MPVRGVFSNAQKTVTFAPGGVIFEQGDTGEEMFGIVEGEVELRMGTEVLNTLGAGDVFGELALVDSSPRSATAVAKTEAVLAVIDRKLFVFLVHESPTFALQVMSAMAERLRALS